jgi:exopolysaccharide biosynthesis polyprenyl glycosylphosphotransferase
VRDTPGTTDLGIAELTDVALEAPSGGASSRIRERTRLRESFRRRMLLLGDVVALGLALGILALVRSLGVSLGEHLACAAAAIVAGVLLAKTMRLYDGDAQRIFPRTLDEVPRLVVAAGGAALLATFVLASVPGSSVSRWDPVLLWTVAVVLVTAGRVIARAVSRRMAPPERIAIVGRGPLVDVLGDSCRKRPHDAELCSIGALEDLAPEDTAREVARRCVESRIDRVVLVPDAYDVGVVVDLTRRLRDLSIGLSLVPSVTGETSARILVEHVDGVGVLGVPPISRTRSTMVLKRAFDLTIALPALVLLLPSIALIALAVRLSSPGPAFYRQVRIGRHGEPFTMLKFRSMYDGAHARRSELAALNTHEDTRLFKLDDDPRVTKLGHYLRRTSLDELPQLINVLQGRMSIVGPRPLLEEEDGHVVGWHRRRLDLAPGLTGPWQVLQEHQVPFEAMVKIDTLYVLEWSPWTDVKIILRTLPVVAGRRSR